MAWLVKSGQEKIRKASKAAELAGSFAENILLIKPMGDFLIENIPQAAPAAIPWACVCMALEMLCKPSQSNKANLEGVKYVTARMEWYCALSDHILDDKSLKLEERVLIL
ncbi:MAG: hypothetical protein STHCBS139747_001848 [Sporothrix thermara]